MGVLLVDIDAAALEKACAELEAESNNPGCAICLGDVSVAETMTRAVAAALERWGAIRLLVNNAGRGADGEFEDVPPAEFDRVMAVNFTGVVNGCRAVWPTFRRQGRGRIINVSSLAGIIPGGLMTSYTASKWAVTGFSLGLRAEGRGRGIGVTCFCPGFIETALHDRTKKWSSYLEHPRNQRKPGRFPPAEVCLPAIKRMIRKDTPLVIAPRGQAIYWWLFRIIPSALPRMWTLIIERLREDLGP
jgi:NAD(P)-dependent dehydrogenase (short-subunit alcohol dehydrogenase family)